jgi:hypothetical protein
MSKVDQLVRRYEAFAALPWERTLAGAQRVWFAVYDKTDERRIRARLDEFALATGKARHSWALCDLTDAFAEWMASQEYRDAYFVNPSDMEFLLEDFAESIRDRVTATLDSADENTVVALVGIASLFGFLSVSDLVQSVADRIRGRMLVLFPGEYENNQYRLLDAGDGWNYLAVPITAHQAIDAR